MIVEHPDLPAVRVASVVRREWLVEITTVRHLADGSTSWHWGLGDDRGPKWYATVDAVHTDSERHSRVEAFEAATQVAQRLSFAVAPVPTRDARIAHDIAPGLLLTLTPYLDGVAAGTGPLTDDVERGVVASMMGDLHQQPRPQRLQVWRPRLGWHDDTERADLERALAQDDWSSGPWSVPASRVVTEARPVIRQALRRFALLGAAVAGNLDSWVVTHGEPRARNLVRTPDGPRLVGWSRLALAPRERDLREALSEAETDEPWYSYLEAGGRAEPLSPDAVKLFALQWHLSVVCEHAVRFSRPHQDTADERRCFAALERELGALVARWA